MENILSLFKLFIYLLSEEKRESLAFSPSLIISLYLSTCALSNHIFTLCAFPLDFQTRTIRLHELETNY